MKTVVSVSQGASEDDYELATEFLGQPFRLLRLGTDGSLERAEAFRMHADGALRHVLGLGVTSYRQRKQAT